MVTSHDAVQALVQVARNGGNWPALRISAIEGLGFAGGSDARSVLLDLMSEESNAPIFREAAARALGHAAVKE